ncbi:SRPBCC family protein [Nocardioides bruguierae]|uniref:SRPBCC family protein n=1 Tax=Nocardioides bruguierae TaxID=2945102 RepID=UPI0020206102|nr:SRPBCC family protein [Nocardioides bruguierae]MCL8026521.1 SRPBCC family protein [Nocardioides bruguierae]
MGEFQIARSTRVAADPADVQALVVDFHRWRSWSPWEDTDPGMERVYSGAESGVGAAYAWSGNRKAGAGSMRIVEVTPTAVTVGLAFTRPMRAENTVVFGTEPVADGTLVTWTMQGVHAGLMGLLARFVPMEKLVAGDFEKGLAAMKTQLEAGVPEA